jgi:uncharacterized protein
MDLDLLRGEFAIVQLDAGTSLPAWAEPNGHEEFHSNTQTLAGLSIVCESSRVPEETTVERGWRCLKVAGPLEFSLVGVLASLAEPLARASVPIFVISTFDTDYVLIKTTSVHPAIEALESAGHVVREA